MAERTTGGAVAELRLERIERQRPWEAYVLPLSGFPTPKQELWVLKKFWAAIAAAAAKSWKLHSEVFLHVTELHVDDGADLVAEHGPEWVPMTGLGVWPDRPPPRLWTMEDFQDLMPGESPPTIMFTLLRATKGEDAGRHARDVMMGRGAVIQVQSQLESDAMLERSRDLLLPMMKERAYTAFPFYLPLFDAKSLTEAAPQQMDEWSCGSVLYIRESVTDKAVVIASRQPLEPILADSGARQEDDRAWLIAD